MHTLEDLESGALAGARQVRLTHQGLTAFPHQLLQLADTLEVLDLSGNQLTSLPAAFARLHKLRILFASDNPWTTLPPVLGQCAQLEMVGFKGCRIREVPASSLPPQLRWLILTDNQLQQLPAALGQRPRLQKLMLSCNQLDTLPDLSACGQLELVRIASNRFTTLPERLLHAPALAWLAIAGNPITQEHETKALAHACHNPVFYPDLVLQDLLGEGASGHIWQALHRSKQQPLAVKVFKSTHSSDGTPQSELAAGFAITPHPHLLTPSAVVSGLPQSQLAMALPLLPGGYECLAQPPSLDSCTRDIYAPQARWSAATADALLRSMRSAVQHLHAQGVLHGDLYAHNILWQPASGHAVLSD